MDTRLQNPKNRSVPGDGTFAEAQKPRQPTPAESARYTADLLQILKKMAVAQGQTVLAHLLDIANYEAKMLGKLAPDQKRD